MSNTFDALHAALSGRYRLERELGAGGMGTVYLAHDLRHERRVAIKAFRSEIAEELGAERFQREVRIAAGLDHPHILMLIDSGEAAGVLYYVMPFVDGESLRQRLAREGPLPLVDAVRLTAQIADALAHAHDRGIVHRDVKPDNILLSGGHAKLADFGIALLTDGAASRITRTGMAVGTPLYMSPEQYLGEEQVDGRSDLYALACVCFEMLTGAPPFAGANVHAALARRITEDAPRVSEVNRNIPPMVDMVLARALARHPAERHTGTREFGGALLAEISGASTMRSSDATGDLPATSHRAPLIGRERELQEARRMLADLAQGRGGVLLLGGEPGVGKTRLAQTIMDEARKQRAMCLVGRCYEMEGMAAYTPQAEVLDYAARVMPRSVLRQALGDAAGEIARILPALRQMYDDIPEPLEVPPDRQRALLFTKYREFSERAASIAPIVILFDDLHWGDEASLSLLENSALWLPSMPILVIGTYRDTDLEVNRPFARVMESLTRQRLVTKLAIRRLPEDHVAELLGALAGITPPSALTHLIHRETDGNPFFVEEVFHHLREEGRLFAADGSWRTNLSEQELDVPEGVRLVIGRRLERLSSETKAVLITAAVIGPRVPLNVLQAVDNADEDALIDALEAAEKAHLMVAQRGRDASWAFSHELIRQTLLGELSVPRRQRRHLKIADAWEQVLGARAMQRPAEIAYHLYQSGAAADADRTVRFLVAAADRSVESAAFSEALAHCDRASQIDDVEDWGLLARLMRARGMALAGQGRWSDAMGPLMDSQRLFAEAGDLPNLAPVALDVSFLLGWSGHAELAEANLDRIMPLIPADPSSERALLAAQRGMFSCFARDSYEPGQTSVREALAMARVLGNERLIGMVYVFATHVATFYGRYDEALRYVAEGVPRLQEPGSRQWLLELLGHEQMSNTYRGAIAVADAEHDRIERLAEDGGHLGTQLLVSIAKADRAFAPEADVDAYGECLDELRERLPSILPVVEILGGYHSLFAHLRGRPNALEIAQRAAGSGLNTLWPAFYSGAVLWTSAHLDNTEWLAAFAKYEHLMPLTEAPVWVGRQAFALLLVRTFAERDLTTRAAALLPALKAASDNGNLMIGPFLTDSGVAIAGTAAGDFELAEERSIRAMALAARESRRVSLADAQRWYAWMLAQRNAPGDHARARELLTQARTTFVSLGVVQPLPHVDATLARLS